MESILDSIKEMFGPNVSYDAFDTELIVHINTALMYLRSLGIGPDSGFSISDNTATWSDFLGDRTDLHAVKTYVYLKVKSFFDPYTSSSLIQAAEKNMLEMEWRLLDLNET